MDREFPPVQRHVGKRRDVPLEDFTRNALAVPTDVVLLRNIPAAGMAQLLFEHCPPCKAKMFVPVIRQCPPKRMGREFSQAARQCMAVDHLPDRIVGEVEDGSGFTPVGAHVGFEQQAGHRVEYHVPGESATRSTDLVCAAVFDWQGRPNQAIQPSNRSYSAQYFLPVQRKKGSYAPTQPYRLTGPHFPQNQPSWTDRKM